MPSLLVTVLTLAAVMVAPGAAGALPPADVLTACAQRHRIGDEIREVRLTVRRVGTPFGDEGLRLTGVLPFSSEESIDPVESGLWLVVTDIPPYEGLDHAVIADVEAPGGSDSDWRAARDGRRWSYRAPGGATTGVRRAVVEEVAPNLAYASPRAYRVRIDVRTTAFTSATDLDTHMAWIGFGTDPTTVACKGRMFWPRVKHPPGYEPWETPPTEARCLLSSRGRGLDCRSPRRVGPCRVGDPEDLIRCTIASAVAAQTAYRSATGQWLPSAGSNCDDLRGFRSSPGVAWCRFWSDGTVLSVWASHPVSPRSCSWYSDAPSGHPNPICYY